MLENFDELHVLFLNAGVTPKLQFPTRALVIDKQSSSSASSPEDTQPPQVLKLNLTATKTQVHLVLYAGPPQARQCLAQ